MQRGGDRWFSKLLRSKKLCSVGNGRNPSWPHLPHWSGQTSADRCSATVGPIDSPFGPLEAEKNPLSDEHTTVAHNGVPRVPRAFLGFPPKIPLPLTPASWHVRGPDPPYLVAPSPGFPDIALMSRYSYRKLLQKIKHVIFLFLR